MNKPNNLKYRVKTQTTTQRGKEILVEHLSPTLDVAERKKKIEESLYEVFQKYDDKSPKTSG